MFGEMMGTKLDSLDPSVLLFMRKELRVIERWVEEGWNWRGQSLP